MTKSIRSLESSDRDQALIFRLVGMIAIANTDLGLTIREIADVLSITTRAVRKYRSGKVGGTRPKAVSKLARIIHSSSHGPMWSYEASVLLMEMWLVAREDGLERFERMYGWHKREWIANTVGIARTGRKKGVTRREIDAALFAYAYLREMAFAPRHFTAERRPEYLSDWELVSGWLESLMNEQGETAWSTIERWKIVTDRIVAWWNELSPYERASPATLDFIRDCQFFETQEKYRELVPGNYQMAHNVVVVASGTRQRKYYERYYAMMCRVDRRWESDPMSIENLDSDLVDFCNWVCERLRRYGLIDARSERCVSDRSGDSASSRREEQ